VSTDIGAEAVNLEMKNISGMKEWGLQSVTFWM
jgi:hypothetical protein